MKKSVIQAVAVTVALLISASCLIYVCLAFCSPVTLAKAWDGLGSYSLSVKYYCAQYEKTDDINDLAAYAVKLDEKKDAKRTAAVISDMTEREDFNAYCEKQDAAGGYVFHARDYFYGKYTVATFYEKGIDDALDVAERGVKDEYSDKSPFYILMAEAEELTDSDATAIAAKIGAIMLTGGLSVKELANANADVAMAYDISK